MVLGDMGNDSGADAYLVLFNLVKKNKPLSSKKERTEWK